MIVKKEEKQKAIRLRKQGLPYSSILKEVHVAKSTLSLWLRSVGLSEKQKQKLTDKKLFSARKGAEKRKQQRIIRKEKIQKSAEKDIVSLNKKELWLIGIMLYWAEGTKEKENRPGTGVLFTNSDPSMIKLFLKWLIEVCNINKERIDFDVFIHENHRFRINDVINYWSKTTGFDEKNFKHVYYKKNKITTNRKNTGQFYFGLIKIHVKESSELNRKIAGWIKGVVKYYSI